MTELAGFYDLLRELEGQRSSVLDVKAALLAQARTIPSGSPVGDVAGALAEASAKVRQLDDALRSVRQSIIAARLARGDAPDLPAGTVSAWWPYLGPGSP